MVSRWCESADAALDVTADGSVCHIQDMDTVEIQCGYNRVAGVLSFV